jgi:hypothetical protein
MFVKLKRQRKMKYSSIIIFAFFFVLLSELYCCGCADGLSSAENGTASSPCQLSDAADLEELMSNMPFWDKHFKFIDDINCSSFGWPNMPWNAPFPIGNFCNDGNAAFLGNFNGQGFTISNLSYDLPSIEFIGFLGLIGNEITPGYVANLRLTNINSIGVYSVLEFCGTMMNSTISNCSSSGSAYSIGHYAGGFYGLILMGTISHCSASGDLVSMEHTAGGFCGYLENGSISNCFSLVNATALYSYSGVFCGVCNSEEIKYCYSLGSTTSQANYGGFQA